MKASQALTIARLGFVCARYSKKPIPSTPDELYAMIEDIGLGEVKGLTTSALETKIEKFLKDKRYDAAMTVV